MPIASSTGTSTTILAVLSNPQRIKASGERDAHLAFAYVSKGYERELRTILTAVVGPRVISFSNGMLRLDVDLSDVKVSERERYLCQLVGRIYQAIELRANDIIAERHERYATTPKA